MYETLHFEQQYFSHLFCAFQISSVFLDITCCLSSVMPSKATLFNCNCEPIYDFGTGHRNVANFNPQGNNILNRVHVHVHVLICCSVLFYSSCSTLFFLTVFRPLLCLAGFGNLRGNMVRNYMFEANDQIKCVHVQIVILKQNNTLCI